MAIDYCEVPYCSDKDDIAAIYEYYDAKELTSRQINIDGWLVAYDRKRYSKKESVEETIEERFQRLTRAWSEETMHLSSVSATINNRHYQQIIGMGWDVVPLLLNDLQRNKRFWFPALAAITGIRPFDSSDLSNPRRMTEAWMRWGKNKRLI